MNGTIVENSIPVVIMHALVVLSITLASLPPANAAGLAAAAGSTSTGKGDLSGIPEGFAAGEWKAVQGLIRQAEYQLTWHEPSNAYTAPNRANGLRLAFGAGGAQVRPSDPAQTWNWSLALTGYGTLGAVQSVTRAPIPVVDANRVSYRWDTTLTEWYVNDERGLEQGFTIAAPPAGAQGSTLAPQIVLEMALETDLVPQLAADGQSITFRRPAQSGWQISPEVLRHDGLHVSDGVGRQLPARMRLSGCGQAATCRLELVIDTTSAIYPLTIDSLVHSQVAKLTASDAEDSDNFGNSVAVNGDTVVVGARDAAVGGNSYQGAAYVYTRNSGGADAWGQVQKLTASDAQDYDNFGWSVAISGDTVVVGADTEDGGGSSRGAAYVYARNSGGADNWGEVKKLTASDAEDGDWFGTSVAISGDTIVVGALRAHGTALRSGAAYVYARNSGGADNWGEVKKLTASDAQNYDQFGGSVAISGDTIVVGADWKSVWQRGAAYVYARNSGGADNWGQVKKLTDSDAEDYDWFGGSVAISGDTIVVGIPGEDGGGSGRGAACVYARNADGADNWGQVRKLTASDTEVADGFGVSVAISGDMIVVGAPGEDGAGTDRGAAYTFVRLDGAWQQAVKPIASEAQDDDDFSTSVAISGDTVVVGAPGEGGAGDYRGAAYVYTRNSGGGDNWGQIQKLTASDAQDYDNFGSSVAISGDTIVVGVPGEDGAGSGRGAAYVYARNADGADNWGQVKKLTASDTEDDDGFGTSVAISGDTVVVGAAGEDDAGTDRGAAYVYARNAYGADNWGQVKKLTDSNAEDNDFFGSSVSISGDTIVVGIPGEDGGGSGRGAAYVYARNGGGADNWGQVKKLTASDTKDDDGFGISVAISGDTVVIGAGGEDGAGTDRGAAYVYARNYDPSNPGTPLADNWGQVQKLTASDATDGDWFGLSVVISDDTVVIGAPDEDGAGSDRGAAYVYVRNSGGADNWGQVKKLTASDAEDDDGFGTSVAISGGTVVVGTPGEDGAGSDRGAAYIFTAGPYLCYLILMLRSYGTP